MGDIKLSISIKEENNILFKRCIRKLLDSTFIVGDKDEKLYAFVSRESNRQDISDYLRMIGFDVLVDTNVRIAMLKPHEADEEAVGLKRENVVSFTNEQYHLLLVLWEVYLENLGYNDENVVMRGDLIDYDIKDESEETIITLYPSLQFGWDIAQFQTVTEEYMKNSVVLDDVDAIDSENIEEEDEE